MSFNAIINGSENLCCAIEYPRMQRQLNASDCLATNRICFKYGISLLHLSHHFFVLKNCMLLMSVAYIQVHFRLDFFMEANNMNHDQAAPKGAV